MDLRVSERLPMELASSIILCRPKRHPHSPTASTRDSRQNSMDINSENRKDCASWVVPSIRGKVCVDAEAEVHPDHGAVGTYFSIPQYPLSRSTESDHSVQQQRLLQGAILLCVFLLRAISESSVTSCVRGRREYLGRRVSLVATH